MTYLAEVAGKAFEGIQRLLILAGAIIIALVFLCIGIGYYSYHRGVLAGKAAVPQELKTQACHARGGELQPDGQCMQVTRTPIP